MNSFKRRPMAVIGFTALMIMLIIVFTGHLFEGGAVAVTLGLIVITVTVISKKLREVTVLFYLSAALLFSGFLMIGNSACSYDAANTLAGEDVTVVAKVTGESEASPSKSTYILKTVSLNGNEIDVKLRLSSNTSLSIYAGDEVTFKTDVYSLGKYSDSLKRYYMSEGMYLTASIFDGEESLEILKDGSDTFSCKLQLLRDEIKSRIYSLLPNEYGGIAVAMLLGDKSGISDETDTAFKNSGISHLFAVSGLHLSIWIMGLYALLRKLGVRQQLNSVISIAFTFFIMALTGFSASISRAGVMLIIMMLGNMLNRKSDSLNSLGFAVFVILAVNPMAASSVSLLLSFFATLGIILSYPLTEKLTAFSFIKIKLIRKTVKGFVSIFAISFVATLFTLPVNAAVFGQVSVIGPFTNVLVSYPSTLLMLTAGITAVIQPISFIANAVALVCGLCAKYIVFISHKLSDLPFSVVKTDGILFEVSFIFLLCMTVCCFIIFKEKLMRIKSVIAVTLITALVSTSVHLVYNHNLTTLKIMDVDDGLCIIVEKSGEKVVLGCGSSDKYALEEVSYEIFNDASLLVVPNSNEWNSSLALDLTKSIDFERTVCGETVDYLEADVVSDFELNPWENASIEFHNNDDLTYAYCVFDGTDVLIVFDCEQKELSHLEADILICSYYLPANTDLSSFDNIVISSLKAVCEDMISKYSTQNSNIYSTSGETDIHLELRKQKDAKIILGR